MAEPTLERGSKGDDVSDLQQALIELDFKPGGVDGVFGIYTESAVRSFQAWAKVVADGVVGPLTWEKIDAADVSDPTLKRGAHRVALGTGHGGQAGIKGEGNDYGVIGQGDEVAGVLGRGLIGVQGIAHCAFCSGPGTGLNITAGDFYSDSTGVHAVGKYAGVFDGDVYVSSMYQSSDKNLKQNVQEFSDAMSLINKLKPRNYEFKTDEKLKVLHLPKGKHYGLIAQDVAEVLPGLVADVCHNLTIPKLEEQTTHAAQSGKTSDEGSQKHSVEKAAPEMLTTKAVNYTELIPIMIKGMQEQEAEIKAKDEKIADLEARLQKVEVVLNRNSNTVTSVSGAYLDQNTPNPASGITVIRYHIPATATTAYISITDAKGAIIKTISLNNRGTGQVNLNTSVLAAGNYNYTLWVDGNLSNTKRLLIAR